MSDSNDFPYTDPEAYQQYLINLSMNAAREKLENGTASNQLICHFLKLATEKEVLEKEKLKKENELLEAKTGAIREATDNAEIYANAMRSLMIYRGEESEDI